MSTWAPLGQPPKLPHRWSSKKYVAVFAAISERSGCLLQMYKWGEAFNAKDIEDFLLRLRLRVGKHKPLAVFMDNVSIHKRPAKEAEDKHKIKVIWNAPYRPDLNGIEFFWGRIKRAYRKEVTRLRSQRLDWDQQELVASMLRDVGFPCARDCAAMGWRNLRKAVIKPAPKPQDQEEDPAAAGEDDVGEQDELFPREEIQDSKDGEEEQDLPLQDEKDAPLLIQQVGEDSDAQEME